MLLAVGAGAAIGGGAAGSVCRGGVDRVAAGPAGQRGGVDPDGAVVAGPDPAGRVEHADHRGRGLPRRVGGRLGAGPADVQRLRPHRDHHLGHLQCAAVGGAGRSTSATPIPGVCALVLDAWLNPAPGRGGGRAVSERARAGARLCGPGGVDRGTVRGQPFFGPFFGRWSAHVPHRRPGALDRRRLAGLLGRADSQIKLRGQRIELGEIENTLLACPQVTQAAATMHESGTGGAQLVAYIALEHATDGYADGYEAQDAEIVERVAAHV